MIAEFELGLLNGIRWNSRIRPERWLTLLAVYRGMWCPNCKRQLLEFERLHAEFVARGVSLVAVSADTEERARRMAEDYGLQQLTIGYEIPIASARELGVFISKREKEIEMPLFCEPRTFLINEHARIVAAWVASNALARTQPADILAYTDFLREHGDRPP